MVLMAMVHFLFFPRTGHIWNVFSSSEKSAVQDVHGKEPAPRWGRLEYVPLALDRPDDYFTNAMERPVEPRWVLRNRSQQQISQLFDSLNLTEPARSFFLDPKNWEQVADKFQIKPPPDMVVNIPSEARGKLYTELATFPENVPQRIPFTFRTNGFEEWFSECGLTREKIDLVRKLTYTKSENLCFADASVFGQLSTPEETTCLLKSLWRVSTFMLKIKVDPDTDIDALLKYWGKIGPAQVYRPLLESMSRITNGSSINISYFLPQFARLRLYTYPRADDPYAVREDCFWSSMNFFSETPDNQLFDERAKDQELMNKYMRVKETDRQFGDLLLLLANKEALHMCVYLADDVVFTKNGANTIQPWVLMKIPEMLGVYQRLRPFEIVYYRRKDLSTATGTLMSLR